MITSRQTDIFNEFLAAPSVSKSAGEFLHLGRERTTIFRDLKALVEAGLLVADGKSYRIDPDSDSYMEWDLSRAPHLRAPVKYNPALLDRYTPNETFLLSDAQLDRLGAAGRTAAALQSDALGKPYERVLSSLMIDLTHASSNLESVNISWLDTKSLIEFGERPEGLTEKQMRIVLNHKAAIGHLKEHRLDMNVGKADLMDLHTLLIGGLLGDPLGAGVIRTKVVRFDGSAYTPPDNQAQLSEAFDKFCEKASAIANPHEQAFFAMTFIPYLQPFIDGNKRTSRIAMNIPLVKAGLSPFSFADVSKRDYMFGLLAFYERGHHRFLASAFVDAYTRSALRYGELVKHINDGGLMSTLSTEANAPPEEPLSPGAPSSVRRVSSRPR